MKIYEGNSKAQDFLIIILTAITFGLVRQFDEHAHESWKYFIEKYDVSDERQEILNEVRNMWNNCRIKETSQDQDMWFNELYNLRSKFKNTIAKYEKYVGELKAHVFYVLPRNVKI